METTTVAQSGPGVGVTVGVLVGVAVGVGVGVKVGVGVAVGVFVEVAVHVGVAVAVFVGVGVLVAVGVGVEANSCTAPQPVVSNRASIKDIVGTDTFWRLILFFLSPLTTFKHNTFNGRQNVKRPYDLRTGHPATSTGSLLFRLW